MLHIPNALTTTNTDLAACLTAVGIPLDRTNPFKELTGDVKGTAFFFLPRSEDGVLDTGELMLAWENREWHRANPEHPFAYCKCAMQNRAALRDFAKSSRPIAAIRRGRKIGFLHLDAPDAVQAAVFAELRRKS